jgi:glycosyltransferase involved in cell wall biosynthesis
MIIILAEDISEPVDEGIKKYSFSLAKKFIDQDKQNLVFSFFPNKELPHIEYLPRNKFFISFSFFKRINSIKPKFLIYIPFSSTTLMSFIRMKVVSLWCGSAKTIIVSLQKRKHNYLSKLLIAFIKPYAIIVLSRTEVGYYEKLGLKCILSPVGVDTNKFTNVNQNKKQELRKKLNLPINGRIVLHVGHINKGRNIDSIRKLLSHGFKIVVIGSTRFESDNELKIYLEKEGYIFITDYIENIEEYYQASDIYIFPVQSSTSAMEFPLSVLEAMSCNLPILTTNFGGIETYFSETDWFKYYNDDTEMLTEANLLLAAPECKNRDIILRSFSWDKVFDNYWADKLNAL